MNNLLFLPQDVENIIYKYLHNLYMIDIRKDIEYVWENRRIIDIWGGKIVYSSPEHSKWRSTPGKHHFDRYSNNLFLYRYFIKMIKRINYSLFLYSIEYK